MPTAHKIDRRTFVKGLGVAGAAGVGLSGRGPGSPVGSADAIAPLALGALGAAGGVGVGAGWLVRSVDPFGWDEVEGQTWEALEHQIEIAAMNRRSHIKSTFIDNANITEYMEDTVYTEAKVSALNRTGEGLSEDALFNVAMDEVREHRTTIISNFLKDWNEFVDELEFWIETTTDHPDGDTSLIRAIGEDFDGENRSDVTEISVENVELDLPNGDSMEVRRFEVNTYGKFMLAPDPDDYESGDTGGTGAQMTYLRVYGPDNSVDIPLHEHRHSDERGWVSVVEKIDDAFTSVENNLETWVYNVYDDIADGSINVGEAAGPRGVASLAAEDESTPEAAADLRALGIPVDTDRESEVYLSDIQATLYGQVGVSGDYTIEVGETIDPSAESESFYLTYDTSQAEATWPGDNYDSNLSQGELTFTEEPIDNVLYRVTNTENEVAELTADDFEGDADESWNSTEWTADLSEQLENAGGTVLEIEYYSESGETNYETIQLDSSFEVVSITGADGEEVTEANYETREPQNDNNYVSQEEWDDLQERNEELIEQYEDAQDNGFLGGGFGDIDVDDIGGSAAVVGAVVAVGAFGIIRQAIKFYLPGR